MNCSMERWRRWASPEEVWQICAPAYWPKRSAVGGPALTGGLFSKMLIDWVFRGIESERQIGLAL